MKYTDYVGDFKIDTDRMIAVNLPVRYEHVRVNDC